MAAAARLEAQGRGYLLYYGLRVRGRWWRTSTWTKSTAQWPAHLVALLSPLREVLLATEWCGGHFILELTRDGRMDELTILAEARPESWDGNGLTDHAERVSVHIKNTIGITARVKAVAPNTLERSLGKAKRVYDKRPKG